MVMESTILVNCCHQLIVMDTDWYFFNSESFERVFSSSFVNIKIRLPCPFDVVNLHDKETAIM